MVDQIIAFIEKSAKENDGWMPNKKTIEYIRQNAGEFDRMIPDEQVRLKTEMTEDRDCIVQFVSEQGAVYGTYTFFNSIVAASA